MKTLARIGILLTILCMGCTLLTSTTFADDDISRSSVARDMAAGSQLVETLPLVEILGPLAPIALSPFFGIACLSGAAILVDNGVLPDNAFLSGNSILSNELVFMAFLGLAILTSLPRLTKVSKPVAQLADQLETWAVVIAFGVILFVSRQQPEVVSELSQAGFVDSTANLFLMAAVVLNIFVINTVRFFFEVLILLSPIPAVDALFEAANKAFAAALMGVYLFSPTLATFINLIIFAISLIIFLAIWKRVRCWRSLLYGLLFKVKEESDDQEMKAFVQSKQPGLKKLSVVHLKKSGTNWTYQKGKSAPAELKNVTVTNGIIRHTIKSENNLSFVTSRRYDAWLQAEANAEHSWKDLKKADLSTIRAI